MPIDALEHVAQVRVGLHAVEPCRLDETEGDGRRAPAALGTGEEPVLPLMLIYA
jgi:hypothetical protein